MLPPKIAKGKTKWYVSYAEESDRLRIASSIIEMHPLKWMAGLVKKMETYNKRFVLLSFFPFQDGFLSEEEEGMLDR